MLTTLLQQKAGKRVRPDLASVMVRNGPVCAGYPDVQPLLPQQIYTCILAPHSRVRHQILRHLCSSIVNFVFHMHTTTRIGKSLAATMSTIQPTIQSVIQSRNKGLDKEDLELI